MSQEWQPTDLMVEIDDGADAPADELDGLTRSLREELLEFDVQSVNLQRNARAPAGTKSAEAVTLGALAITVLPTVLPRVIEFLQSWTLRADTRKMRIKTQIGDRSLEIEFGPGTTTPAELKAWVDILKTEL